MKNLFTQPKQHRPFYIRQTGPAEMLTTQAHTIRKQDWRMPGALNVFSIDFGKRINKLLGFCVTPIV